MTMSITSIILIDNDHLRVTSFREFSKLKNITFFDFDRLVENDYIIRDVAPSLILIDSKILEKESGAISYLQQLKEVCHIIILKEKSDVGIGGFETIEYPIKLGDLFKYCLQER